MKREQESKQAEEDTIDVGAALRTILRRWPSVLLLTVISTVISGFILSGMTKIYSAEVTLKIEPQALRPLGRAVESAGDTWGAYWANKEYYSTQYKLLQSRALAEEVVKELSLHTDRYFMQGKGSNEELRTDRVEPSTQDAAMVLQSRLSVQPEEDTHLLLIQYEDSDPERAHRILSAIARVYIRRNLDSSVDAIGSASTWLNEQLDQLKGELETSEMSLHNYKKDKNLISASLLDQSNMLRAEMEQLNTAVTSARTLREGLAARVALLRAIDEEHSDAVATPDLLEDTTLTTLRESYLAAAAAVTTLKAAGKGAEHPQMREALATKESTHAALIGEIANYKQAAEAGLRAADKEISGLRRLYDDAEKRAFELNLLEIEYKRLTRAKDNTERLHTIVLERSRESELNSRMRFNNISIVDPALVPSLPVRPRIPLGLATGALLGAFLGMALALLRQRLDQSIKGTEGIERELGLTCVGAIPLWTAEGGIPKRTKSTHKGRANTDASLLQPEMFVHTSPSSLAAEAVRSLRTNILFMSPDRPYKSLLLTSPSPSDGKTTMACSIAISLAQSGKRVLLVDADLRRPRLSTLFAGTGTNQGLTNALLDPALLPGLTSATGIPDLYILKTGPLPPNPAELLHSQKFQNIFETVSAGFDHVVIDSPPLMPVTDATVLTRLADATLLVVRSSLTRRDHALRAIRTLRDVDANLLGAVLNEAPASPGYDYYYYAQGKPNANSPAS